MITHPNIDKLRFRYGRSGWFQREVIQLLLNSPTGLTAKEISKSIPSVTPDLVTRYLKTLRNQGIIGHINRRSVDTKGHAQQLIYFLND